MANTLHFNFSQTCGGVIWNIVHVPGSPLLILEIRNEDQRETRFSALDVHRNTFIWENILFEEAWWIGLTAASREVLLLHVYKSTENPDGKDLIAWHIHQEKILWRLDNFSFDFLSGSLLQGRFLEVENDVVVDVNTGIVLKNNSIETPSGENIPVLKPFQYVEGSAYYETVKSFLLQQRNVEPLPGVEYLEYNSLIFISYHVQQESLVNYLMVLTNEGSVVLDEKLGEGLKGIGLETFFILSGCLFFVRNKCALVSYRIV